jgi:hypothetical protein
MTNISRAAFATGLMFSTAFLAHGAQQNEGDSPSGQIHFVVRGAQDEKKISLSLKGNPKEEVVLCDTPGWGNLELHFSPDDNYIAVQDGGDSLGISLRLFRRTNEAAYAELTEVDLNRAAELAALKQNNLPARELLDHSYLKVLAWSGDSRSLLISLSGHGGDDKSHIRINKWIGFYDVATGVFGSDLREINQTAIQTERKN